jgi:hypothetical protein
VPIVDDRRNFPHRALRWPLVVTSTSALPNIRTQAETLVALGVHELAGWTARALLDVAEPVRDRHALFVIGSDLVSASTFASLVRVRGKRGFVVTDMSDVDAFDAVVELPQTPAYAVDGLDRGDGMADWSPGNRHTWLGFASAAGRRPLGTPV